MALVVFMTGIATTALLATWTWRVARIQDELRFTALARNTWEMIETRAEKYEQALANLAEWFGLVETPSLTEWGTRMERFNLAENYHGIEEIDYFVHVEGNYESRWFTNPPSHWPIEWITKHPRPEDLLLYVERPTAGLEMVTNKISNFGMDGAMSEAYRTGLASTSEAIALGNGSTNLSRGFRMWIAAYRKDQMTNTNRVLTIVTSESPSHRFVERGNALVGRVCAIFSADKFLDGIFGKEPGELDFEWFAGAACETNRLNNLSKASRTLAPNSNHELHANLVIPWYRHRWKFVCYPTPLFYSHSERGRSWLVAGMGSALSVALALLVYVQGRGRQNAELLAQELAESRDLLRSTSEDRARLSRELHDGSIQSLYAIGLSLRRSQSKPNNPELLARCVDQAADQLDRVIADLRGYLISRRPTEDAPQQTFVRVLEDLTGIWRLSHETEFRIESNLEVDPNLSDATIAELLLFAQEAASNSLRHGKADCVTIRVNQTQNGFLMEIKDDGRGFDPNGTIRIGHGLGNMRKRAEGIGGVFSLSSQPGGPTRVTVEITQ